MFQFTDFFFLVVFVVTECLNAQCFPQKKTRTVISSRSREDRVVLLHPALRLEVNLQRTIKQKLRAGKVKRNVLVVVLMVISTYNQSNSIF